MADSHNGCLLPDSCPIEHLKRACEEAPFRAALVCACGQVLAGSSSYLDLGVTDCEILRLDLGDFELLMGIDLVSLLGEIEALAASARRQTSVARRRSQEMEELRSSTEALRAADLASVAATLAHEGNSIVGAMVSDLAFATDVLGEHHDSDVMEAIEAAARSSERIASVFTQLRKMANVGLRRVSIDEICAAFDSHRRSSCVRSATEGISLLACPNDLLPALVEVGKALEEAAVCISVGSEGLVLEMDLEPPLLPEALATAGARREGRSPNWRILLPFRMV